MGQSDVGDGADHLAELVGEVEHLVVRGLGAAIGVRAGGVVPVLWRPEVVVDHVEPVLAEDPGDRVELGQVEEAARADQRGDHTGPAPQIGEPVDGAEAGVDDVEGPPAERAQRVVHVGVRELGGDAGIGRQPTGGLDGGSREVEPGHPGPATGPSEGVGTDVALQVDEVEPVDRAHLLDLERPQRVGAVADPVEVVEAAGGVDRHPLVPPGAVGLPPPLDHPATLPTVS